MKYLHFVRANLRLLSFGAAAFFFSSFGQTFFISLFNAPLQADLALSSGEIGLLYSAATLMSALTLMWLGRKIDDWDLRFYAVLACALVLAGRPLKCRACMPRAITTWPASRSARR